MKKEEEKVISEFIKKHQFFKKYESEDIQDFKTASIVLLSGLRPNNSPDNPLTTMEMFSLMLSATGRNSDQCADLLGVKLSSFIEYERRTREKLNAKNRTHALFLTWRNNHLTLVRDENNF